MTGLDERYIAISLLNDFFIDKDSNLPMANGTLSFRSDETNDPKAVFQLVSTGGKYEYVELPNPVPLNSAGLIENSTNDNVAIYLFPFRTDPVTSRLVLELYLVECKNSADVEQWTRRALPNLTNASSPVNTPSNYDPNQLANPQFTRYFLSSDIEVITLVLSGSVREFPIAPDWMIVAGGTGTLDIERVAVAGNESIPTSPAYYLRITVGLGVSNPFLRQRLNKNSGLWSGNFVSGFVAAKVESGSNSLTMKYQDSAGINSNVTIFSAGLSTSWETYGGAVQLDDSSNTEKNSDAFVDITIELPIGNITDITSLQVVSTESSVADIVPYSKRTANREQALMGDYYIPRLEFKPIPSFLIGWDFPLNPTQLGDSGTVVGATAEYIWDQTILQTSSGLTVAYERDNERSGGLRLTHQQADLPYALIQYLEGGAAEKFIASTLSVNINGYTRGGGSSAAPTNFEVKIFANLDNDKFPTLPLTIVDVDSQGVATLTAAAAFDGWVEIPRQNIPTAKGTLKVFDLDEHLTSTTTKYDVGFNNWLVDSSSTIAEGTKGIAAVISFLPSPSIEDYITQIDSISVVPGDIPTRPSFISESATFLQCQAYYQKSFIRGVSPASALGLKYATLFIQTNPNTQVHSVGPAVRFAVPFIRVPSVTIFNPRNAGLQIVDVHSITNWVNTFVQDITAEGFLSGGKPPAASFVGSLSAISWVADARLGVV